MFLLTTVTHARHVRRAVRPAPKRLLGALLAACLAAPVLLPVAARAERTVTIRGGGWGHGIGMSQYGAYGRALKGKTSTEILEHYYKGAKVTEKEMPKALRVNLLPGYGGTMHEASFTSKAATGGDGMVVVSVAGSNERLTEGDASTNWRIEAASTGGMKIFKNGNELKKDGRTVFGDGNHPLIVKYARFGSLLHLTAKNNDYRYGLMEFGTYACDGGRCLNAVLKVDMQKYIYGLGEVPSSWPSATLEAQAIAGRTYAYSRVVRQGQHRAPCDCAVYDSTIDQAYIGDAKKTGSGEYWKKWKEAVDATDSRVLIADNEPIQALYSSSSGGYTENNENVWGGSPISYLRGVPDNPDYADGKNPNFQWELEMSWSEFENKLNGAYGIGSLKGFTLLKPFGVSGRVTVVKGERSGGARIAGTDKIVRESGWSLRSALGLKDTLFRVVVGYEIAERFKPKWNDLEGAPGTATSALYRVPKGADETLGRAQDFEVGRMTDVTGGSIVWQWGKILRKYETKRREKGPLGMPKSSIWGPGKYRGATYANGRILWSKDTGPHALLGLFDEAFERNGGVKGRLGLPVADRERGDTLPDGGKRQRFQGGRLYLNPQADAVFAVWGAIAKRYRELGEAKSPCGYPTADVVKTDAGSKLDLQKGTITYVDGAVKVAC